MFILEDTGLIILFSVLLITSYFLYERVVVWKALSFLRIKKYILDSFDGLVFGAFTIAFRYILLQIDPNFNIPLFAVVSVIFLLFKNQTVSLFVFALPLINYTITTNEIAITFTLITIVLSLHLIHIFLEQFLSKSTTNLIIFILLATTSLLMMTVYKFWFEYDITRYTYENSLMIPISFIIIYISLRTSIRISISANILFESANFVFSRYLRRSLLNESAGVYIKENKVEKGILGVFEITLPDDTTDDEKQEIIRTILFDFENEVGEDVVLFSNSEIRYGIFSQLKNDLDWYKLNPRSYESVESDKLLSIIKSLNKPYITTKGRMIFPLVKIGVSYYGIQSNSIDRLEEDALFALHNIRYLEDEYISIFNYESKRRFLNDSKNVILLDDFLGLSDYENKYIKITNLKDIRFVYSTNFDDYDIFNSIDEVLRINNWKSTYDRYFAIEAINEIRDKEWNVIFEYSPILSNKNFDVDNFIRRIKKMNISPKRLKIIVSAKNINGDEEINKLLKLRENGVDFSIKDVQNYTKPIDEKLNPQFIILGNVDEYKRWFKGKAFFPFAENEIEYNKAVAKGIKYINANAID